MEKDFLLRGTTWIEMDGWVVDGTVANMYRGVPWTHAWVGLTLIWVFHHLVQLNCPATSAKFPSASGQIE